MRLVDTARTVTLWCVSLGVAAYAVIAYGFFPLGFLVHPAMAASFRTHAPGVYVHVFAGALALILGPLQFSRRLRVRHPAMHRWTGRGYLGLGILFGGLAGMYLANYAYGGPAARLGFGCLAIAWLITGVQAYLAARARDFASHRRWMVRNFSLTLAAVTLRIYLPLSMAAGVRFPVAYPLIAWLCWVPNLVVAERLFNRYRACLPALDGQPGSVR
jgi:hypothetical protein